MKDKGNLFIVFTPLQLFVAQQIIRQEKLEKCVLIEGYKEFSAIYNIMRIDSLWHERIEWENIAIWDGGRTKSFADVRNTYRNYEKIKTICKKYNIEAIYLGEILNQACRFTAILFSNLGYKINFFEEGTSHYIDRPYTEDNSLKHRMKVYFYDLLYYLPLFHVKFAKWRLGQNMPYDDLPIDKRFSIIPFHNKPYDIRLGIEPMFSTKLKKYVNSNILDANERRVMLMTDPLRELMDQKDLYIYFDTIKECIDNIDNDTILYIKFHPREIEVSRKKILDIASASKKKYKILSEEINICVEYYLQMFKFEKIFFFNAATYFYNGYAFPKTEFVKLMPIVYNKAKAKGICNLQYMENMLKMIEPITQK